MEKEFIWQYNNGLYTVPLHTYYNFIFASKKQYDSICNGAGPRQFGRLVPDNFWGLCITKSADIHDWCCQWGENLADKHQADEMFRSNMQSQADGLRLYELSKKPNWLMKKYIEYKHINRYNMIDEYFKGVDSMGSSYFWHKDNVDFNWRDLG